MPLPAQEVSQYLKSSANAFPMMDILTSSPQNYINLGSPRIKHTHISLKSPQVKWMSLPAASLDVVSTISTHRISKLHFHPLCSICPPELILGYNP